MDSRTRKKTFNMAIPEVESSVDGFKDGLVRGAYEAGDRNDDVPVSSLVWNGSTYAANKDYMAGFAAGFPRGFQQTEAT